MCVSGGDEMMELKPCPFCGGKAVVVPLTFFKEYFAVCSKCHIEQGHLYKSERAAVEAWNRRKEE